MKNALPWVAAAAFALLVAVPSVASAHLAAGQDDDHGPYIADLGYDPASPRAGEPTTLAFNLVKEDTGEAVAPSDVFVRITRGQALVFAGTFVPRPENVTFTYAFPEAGDYEVYAKFDGADGVPGGSVEERMPVEVAKGDRLPASPDATVPERRSAPGGALAAAAVWLLFELCLYFGYTEPS